MYNHCVFASAAAWCALTVALSPARVQIGADRSTASARVVVSGAPKQAHVRLWTSLGTVTEARAVAGGQVEAIYRPPSAGPPAWAMIAAWNEDTGEVGVASVELEARTEIPVDTEAHAQVVVAVANHRATARADTKGHAVATVWVPPGIRSARVTAHDAAGNTTAADVAFEVPTPERVWLIDSGGGGGDVARLYAFALPPSVPEVRVDGLVATVSRQPGVAEVTVRGRGDAVVVAKVADAQVRHELHLPVAAPPPSGVVVAVAPGGFADPRDELGASLGGRFTASLVGLAATGEWRRRLGRSRFHLGVDVGGLYLAGARDNSDRQLGGGFVRAVGEARFYVLQKAALAVGVALGGALVGVRSAQMMMMMGGGTTSTVDGGPSLGAVVSLLARLGPGLMTVALGFYYTPLLGQGGAILDGAALSVGYRGVCF